MTEGKVNSPIAHYDAVVILGRSIGREKRGIKKGDGQTSEPEWRASAYFGRMKEVNGRPIPLPHSGIFDNRIDPNAKGVMVAGGNACALAAAYLVSEQRDTIKTVIFAAGRAPYLEAEDPSISEGSILERPFLDKLKQLGAPKPEILVLSEDKTTLDDMVNSTKAAQERGLRHVAYVTVGVHIGRSREFLNRRVPEETREGLEIDFLAAEDILCKIDARYEKMFKEARKTAAYRRTVFFENRGRRALISGNY